MGLETGTYLNALVVTNPLAGDSRSEGDDHIRLIKSLLQATFPNMGGAFHRVQSKAAGYTVLASDENTVILCTAALTLDLTAAATLGNHHSFVVLARVGAVVIEPAGAELVNGAANLTLPDDMGAVVFCTGTAFYAVVFALGNTWVGPVTGAVTGKATTAQDLSTITVLTGVTITGTAGQFSCTAAANPLAIGMTLAISGTYGGTGSITGYANPTTYKVSATNGSTAFTLTTIAGAPIVTTVGTPTGLTYTGTATNAAATALVALVGNAVPASLTGPLRADAGVLSIGSPLIAFTTITATAATWTPDAKTGKLVVCVVSGGSGGQRCNPSTGSSMGGRAGHMAWGASASVSGTYAATIGAGGASDTGTGSFTTSNAGGNSSFVGTGVSLTVAGGRAIANSDFNTLITPEAIRVALAHGEGLIGGGGVAGVNASGGSAANNTGAGGGGVTGSTNSNSYVSGAGGSGVIYVWEYA